MKRKYARKRWRAVDDERLDRRDDRRRNRTIRERRRKTSWWPPDELQPDEADDPG